MTRLVSLLFVLLIGLVSADWNEQRYPTPEIRVFGEQYTYRDRILWKSCSKSNNTCHDDEVCMSRILRDSSKFYRGISETTYKDLFLHDK